MILFDEETEENLQCGRGGSPKGGGGGGGLATQGSAAAASTKKASGLANSSGMTKSQSGLSPEQVSAAFNQYAASRPRQLAGTTPKPLSGSFKRLAEATARRKLAGSTNKQLQAGATPKATKAAKAPKATKATKAPTNVAQQNRDRIARQKTKAEKAKAKK